MVCTLIMPLGSPLKIICSDAMLSVRLDVVITD